LRVLSNGGTIDVTGVGDESIEAARTVQRYFMLREAALEVD
jgi:hypothetical protein